MASGAQSNLKEWGLIALLLVACAALAVLQYRWTGELSRAETERLRSGAGTQLRRLAQAFDLELRRAVMDVVPAAEAVASKGWERANAEQVSAGLKRLERPVFRRIYAAVPAGPAARRTLRLYEASPDGSRFSSAAWPESPEWKHLRARLGALLQGAPPHGDIVDPVSSLIEAPVFGAGGEQEWIIAELDADYASRVWFPELVRVHLNAGEEPLFRLDVRWRQAPGRTVFSTGGAPARGRADAEASAFPMRFLGSAGGGPAGRGRGAGGRDEGGNRQGRWTLEARHIGGPIDAAVSKSRRRNFGVALALLALIAGAGATLVRYTRSARLLAETQFRFTAGVSHELRTPLTVIQGAAHNLLSGVVKQEAQRESYLRAIAKHAAELGEMVDQILSYAGLRHKGAATGGDSGPVSLAVILADAVESAALELEEGRRSVDLNVPATLPGVHGDAVGLRRVFWNLIGNAVRHGEGEISVSAVEAGAMVEVRVADTGPGIPAGEINQVFTPFFRGERARRGHTRGTGLGLSLVKELVETMGGTVSVESSPKEGTAFTVRLPVHTQ
jgi:signal transduction histidine kinase